MKRDIPRITTNDIFVIREFKNFWDEYCEDHGVVDNRQRKNIIHKHAFLTILKESSMLSLADIGSILNKDHATVLHAHKSHETNYKFDVNYRIIFHRLQDLIHEFMLGLDIVPASMVEYDKDVRSSHFRLLETSKKLRMKMLEFESYKKHMDKEFKRVKAIDNYVRSLEKRNDSLHKELARVKNLI